MGAFGDKLRRQRELSGLSLDAISTITKISPRMLRAIEDEHFDQLPGGVFNKGFVRAYARQIGLDEQEVLTDYLAALRESQVQAQTILPNFRSPGNGPNEAADIDPRNPQRNEPALKTIHRKGDSHQEDRRREDRRREDRRKQDGRKETRLAEVRESPGSDKTNLAQPHSPRREHDATSYAPLSFLNLSSGPASTHLSQEAIPEKIVDPSVPLDDSSPKTAWIKLAAPLLLVTLALALWGLHRRSQTQATSPSTASQTSPEAVASNAPPVATPQVQPTPSTNRTTSLTPPPSAIHSAPLSAPPETKRPEAKTPPVEAAEVTKSVVTRSDPTRSDPTKSDVKRADANRSEAGGPVVKPRPLSANKAATSFVLVIRATQTSWISIAADDQPVARETLIAPANTSVRAAHEIVVRTSNSAGISFLLNNKEIPASGNPGEARTYIFDASGLRASATSPATNVAR